MKPRTKRLLCSSIVVLTCFWFCASAGAMRQSSIMDASGALVKKPPKGCSIVSLAPNITEILYAIGVGDRLVGVSQYSNYPEAAKKLPKVGGFANLNVERIVFLSPGVAVGTMDGNSKAQVEKLRSLGITVFCIYPTNVQGLMQSISQLGEFFDRQDDANALVKNMEAMFKFVKAKAYEKAKQHGRPTVLIALDTDPLISASGQTFIGQLVAMAGGNNILMNSIIDYPKVSVESLVASPPEVILVAGHGQNEALLRQLTERPSYQDMPAVKNGRVFLLDPDVVTRPGPRATRALLDIHEHLFQKQDEEP